MSILRTARWLLLALTLTLIPASAHAGVFISVGIAPPPLPVYVQPDCPQPGLVWTPGYWAYDYDQQSYYWVPGAWVPAPYPGALWTPGYWGWTNGVYVFHAGYWGLHVGYYGGVDYGFGYGGIGYTGGEWRAGHFFYNTAITHVDRRYIHSTFDDMGRVNRGYVARDSHVAFSGGPRGIHYQPSAQERMAEHEQHVGATSFQQRNESTSRHTNGPTGNGSGRAPWNNAQPGHMQNNGEHPQTEPMWTNSGHGQQWNQPNGRNAQHENTGRGASPQPHSQPQPRPQPQSHPQPRPQSHAAPQSHESHANSGGRKDDHERR